MEEKGGGLGRRAGDMQEDYTGSFTDHCVLAGMNSSVPVCGCEWPCSLDCTPDFLSQCGFPHRITFAYRSLLTTYLLEVFQEKPYK